MSNIPPAPEGALTYTHPQGKTIYVLTDGSMVCYKPDGKRASSSATPEKLAAGHGGWEQVEGIPAAAGDVSVIRTAVSPSHAYGIAPQLAETGDINYLPRYVADDRKVMEQKVDGDRVLLDTTNGTCVVRTRNGKVYSKGLPTSLRRFIADEGLPLNIVLDGELVGSTYWAFDLPVSGVEMIEQPLSVRRAALEALRDAGVLGPIRVIPQARTIDEKHDLAKIALTEGYEGLMVKDADSRYRAGGRTMEWVKVKFTKTADVIVTPKEKPDGHNSVAVSVYRHGRLVEVGHASLNGKEKRGAIVEGDVIEVKYLYLGAGNRLYQPTILRRRPDKAEHECTFDQLVPVNKRVLEEIA